jgi:hypothetical protein
VRDPEESGEGAGELLGIDRAIQWIGFPDRPVSLRGKFLFRAGTTLAAIRSPGPTCALDIAAQPRPPAEILPQSAANLP